MSERPAEHHLPAPLPGVGGIAAACRFVFGAAPRPIVGAWAVYLPLAGLLLGGAWLATDLAAGRMGARSLASAAVMLVHAALTRTRPLRALAAVLTAIPAARGRRLEIVTGTPTMAMNALAVLIALGEIAVLSALDRFRTVGLVCAPLLGACSMVVLAVGSRAARPDGRRLKFAPQVGFREFGLASAATFGLVFLTTEFLGLLLILATAAFVIAVRVASHRWLDGVNETVLLATAEATQLVVLATLAVW